MPQDQPHRSNSLSAEPKLTPETAAREPEWTIEGEFADIKLTLHTLCNAVETMTLKLELILRAVRRRDE